MVLSCADQAPPLPGAPFSIRLVSLDTTPDTVDAGFGRVLEVEVRDSVGRPVPGRLVVLSTAPQPDFSVGRTFVNLCDKLARVCPPSGMVSWLVQDSTDLRGRVRALVANGVVARTGYIRFWAGGNVRDSVVWRTLAGRPAGVRSGVPDSTVYVGNSYAIRAHAVDRHGNATELRDPVTYAASGSVTVTPNGVVRGEAVGRGAVVVRNGSFVDTGRVTVTPRATLAAVQVVDGRDSLVRIQLDGSGREALAGFGVTSARGRVWPAWIGSEIAFESDTEPGRIVVIDTLGRVRRLTSNTTAPTIEAHAAAVRDGSILFTGQSPGGFHIWKVSFVGARADTIPTPTPDLPSDLRMPSASPDGQEVAYFNLGIGLRIRRLSDGRMLPLVGTGSPRFPRWSPRGDWIVYLEDDRLMRVRRDATGLVAVSPGRIHRLRAEWIPDSDWLIATTDTGLELIHAMTGAVLPLAWSTGYYAPSAR